MAFYQETAQNPIDLSPPLVRFSIAKSDIRRHRFSLMANDGNVFPLNPFTAQNLSAWFREGASDGTNYFADDGVDMAITLANIQDRSFDIVLDIPAMLTHFDDDNQPEPNLPVWALGSIEFSNGTETFTLFKLKIRIEDSVSDDD